MDLNQTTLRGILATILSADPEYIVPKQGNWWNPQEAAAVRPHTWCAYQIRSNRPVTVPWFSPGKQNQTAANRALVNRIAIIDLQFVGPQAEDLADSVAFWPAREDVAAALAGVQGSMMNTDMEPRSSVFYQDGGNTVLAWNTQIKVHWIQEMYTGQPLVTEVQMGGTIETDTPTR